MKSQAIKKRSKKTATYTYDLLRRITKETKTYSEDISYTYDSNNNRKEMRVGNKITAYKYNKNDELLRTDTLNTDTKEDSVVIYKNDKNGNQLATVNRYDISSDKKDSTYIDIDVTLGDNRLNENVVNHYNAENRLIQTLTKNYKVSFTYDAEGLRTSKMVNGEKTVFVWDGDQLVLELSDSGKVQKRYIRGNDLVYSDKGKDNASSEASEKQYYVTDPHGNVVQLMDESGAVTKTYEYDPFGNEVKLDGKDENPFRYCGEYYDKETEEIYLRARYYQPAVGRFLTRDTYTGKMDEPESLHLYVYCYSNPVCYVDITGNRPLIPQPLPTPRPTAAPTPAPTPQSGPSPTWIEDTMWKFEYRKKQREKITDYCIKYANEEDAHNPIYRWFKGHDCANFVSQCLVYAGFKQTIKWRYRSNPILQRLDSVTLAWCNAKEQYKYFKKNRFAKKVITINKENQIKSKTKKVKTGDLLYWDFETDGQVNYATIITSNLKEKGKKLLKFGGHTKERNNEEVKKFYEETYTLKIIRLRDKFTIPYNF